MPSIDPVAPGTGWLDAGAALSGAAAVEGVAADGVAAAVAAVLVVAAAGSADVRAGRGAASGAGLERGGVGRLGRGGLLGAAATGDEDEERADGQRTHGMEPPERRQSVCSPVLYLYVAAAVVGVVLLGASIFGSGTTTLRRTTEAAMATGSPMLALLSVRVWTYLLAFGGVTGVLLRLVGHEGEPVTGLGLFAVGGLAAAWRG